MPVMTKSPNGDEIVILSRDEYDRLIAADEDMKDAKTARRIIEQIASGEETVLSEPELDEFLKAKTPLSFWRKKRRMTQADLAKAADIAQGFISEIESGQKPGTPATLKKIAQALNIKIDDLIS
ncbi:MAG TPA: helix-turn-helix transcriptional regulator [Bradyrhizobium sp.]|nr:helix-turn-helix transcriptional regulator [Bradyrhizobium sp.]